MIFEKQGIQKSKSGETDAQPGGSRKVAKRFHAPCGDLGRSFENIVKSETGSGKDKASDRDGMRLIGGMPVGAR
jgi:hypothetical protein